jgi:hypothetical protein
MKKKPWSFQLILLVNLLVAFGLPVQIALLYGHSPGEWVAILNKMTVLNWLVIFTCLANAFFAFESHRWVLVSSMAATVTVALNNWVVAAWSTDFPSWMPMTGTLLFFVLHLTLFSRSAQQVLKGPPVKRYTSRSRRYQVEFPIWVETNNLQSFQVKSYDVSLSGAFIPFLHIGDDGEVHQGFPVPLRRGESVLLRVSLAGGEELVCRAEVVRRSQATGNYPGGFGVRFSALDTPARHRLQDHLDNLSSLV